MKVCDLTGQTLDFWVAKADGRFRDQLAGYFGLERDCPFTIDLWTKLKASQEYRPSTDWAIGGPILEREKITLHPGPEGWGAWIHPAIHDPTSWSMPMADGPTPLVAAMRCYVVSKFGEEVPDAEKVGDGPWVSTTDAFTKPPFVKPRIMGEIVAEVFNKAFERKCARCGAVGAVENDGQHFCVALGDGSLSVRND